MKNPDKPVPPQDAVLPPIRCTAEEKARWQEKAIENGEPLSVVIRRLLNRWAARK